MKIIKVLFPYVLIIAIVVFIRTFIITPVIVDGISMKGTLSDKDLILLKKYDKKLERNDIIVFNFNDQRLVKRIIGLPGDYIKYSGGKLYINDLEVEDKFANITADYDMAGLGLTKVPDDYYFVMGDNRTESADSRIIGFIPKKNILGTTTFRLFPFKTFGTFK